MPLMEYENQVFLDAFQEDGLLVMAKGLGIERIFLNFLKVYSDPGNLVLVLNTSPMEESYFLEQLEATETKPMPRALTTEFSASDRQAMYMEGGVFFVTSRILVVDLLTNRMPTDLITGVLVYKAHKIMESCQEAFILRLYRQKNKTGFIKAFSESPQAFTAGFCHVERVMRSLFVRKLFLWPRFQASVVSHMDKHKVDVVELQIPMTALMTACQTALMDLISACVKELKTCNPSMDTDEMTVEYAITRGFDKIIKLHMDPVWHQLSSKTKQLISDIKTLRLLLEYLTQYDCVNFYNLVNSIKSNEKTFGQNSGWLFMDAADSLFVNSKSRVYSSGEKSKKAKTNDGGTSKSRKKESGHVLEECPKWNVLSEVLEEIATDDKEFRKDGEAGKIVVAAQDERTCSQIKEYMCEGGQALLQRLFDKTLAIKGGNNPSSKESDKRHRWKGRKGAKGQEDSKNSASNGLTLTQMVKDKCDEQDKDEEPSMSNDFDGEFCVLKSPFTILVPLHGSPDPTTLLRTLQDVKPRYVVLYDVDITFVRHLEVYKASHPGQALRVYFLMYTSSTEEQRYLTTLRKEKEAFEYLIRSKATMVIPEEREGRSDDDPNLNPDQTAAEENTRQGGLQKQPGAQKVIVDMREFRSELPSLIHRRGIDIEPVTIEVGDYILTPDICVERKSVNDLIGSLNNGRLYNQAVSMCRHYKRPVLLIEFDPNKPFSLQGKYTMSNEINSNDVTAQLALLTQHFPRLRVLWCQSPYATAELFEELKAGRPQPDAATAMAITDEQDSSLIHEKYSIGPKNFLLKMPGITTKNVYGVMNKVTDLSELVSLPLHELVDVVGNEVQAKLLYNFIHKEDNKLGTTPGNVNKLTNTRKPNFKGVKRKK